MKWCYSHRKLLAAVFMAAVILLLLPKLTSMTTEDLLNFTPRSPFLAALALLGVYCVKSVVMVIPNMVICIVSGIVFSPFWGVFLCLAGIGCEAAIGYWIGGKMGGKEVKRLIERNKKAEKFFTFNQKNNVSTCFLARLSPLPIDLTSMFFGASKMPLGRYVFASVLGLSPKMIPYVIAGASVTNPWSAEFLLPFGISFVITGIVFLIYRKVTTSKAS